MLTFTSDVGKLNIRILWQRHTMLHVISQSYCQVFVKSYYFNFEKINIEYAHIKNGKTASILNTCSAYHSATEVHVCCLTIT